MPKPAILLIALLCLAPAWAEEGIPAVATEPVGEPATQVVAAPAGQPTLEDLRWVARPLVVFADTPSDPRFVQQLRMLETDPDALAERRVVVLTDAEPSENGPLRQRLRPRDFGLVLIDIDGSVAHRRPLPASVREIINMIDRMPSRREEIGSRRP